MYKQIIYGNPITKKNSQRIITLRRWNPHTRKYVHRSIILPSKQYEKYEKDALMMLFPPENPINIRSNVKCVYYMETKRRVDLNNLLEATCDILTKAGVLEDDKSTIVAGHDGSRVFYDRNNPRVEIEITELDD